MDFVDSWEMDPAKDTVAEAQVLLSTMNVGDPGNAGSDACSTDLPGYPQMCIAWFHRMPMQGRLVTSCS